MSLVGLFDFNPYGDGRSIPTRRLLIAAPNMALKIAFARMFPKAPVGDSVAQMLENAFPEYQVDTFDVTTLLKHSPGLVAANGVAMMRA